MVPTEAQTNPEGRGKGYTLEHPKPTAAFGTQHPSGGLQEGWAQPSPEVTVLMVSDRELQSSAQSISARAWCSVPNLGTGKALEGPQQHGLQATATTSAGTQGHCPGARAGAQEPAH